MKSIRQPAGIVRFERPSIQKYFFLTIAICLTFALFLSGPSADENGKAPGRKMADQATKGIKHWSTSDHSKFAVLDKEFKSGPEITEACLSCHTEAEAQFHKTIH